MIYNLSGILKLLPFSQETEKNSAIRFFIKKLIMIEFELPILPFLYILGTFVYVQFSRRFCIITVCVFYITYVFILCVASRNRCEKIKPGVNGDVFFFAATLSQKVFLRDLMQYNDCANKRTPIKYIILYGYILLRARRSVSQCLRLTRFDI